MFIAACDNGTTTNIIQQGAFKVPGTSAGDAVIWTPVGDGPYGVALVDDEGNVDTPPKGSGYYTITVVSASSIATAVAGLITTAGATPNTVYKLEEFTGDNSTSLTVTYSKATSATAIPGEGTKSYIFDPSSPAAAASVWYKF